MPSRILAVWTRDIDTAESVGRLNVARAVRDVMARQGEVAHVRLHNLFERPSPRRFAAAFCAFAGGLLRGRPLPLQCLLFADPPDAKTALQDAARREVVYADGVRVLLWLRRVRRRCPGVGLVVDMDDLMSRRCAEMLDRRLPLSLGYLERMLPRPLRRLVTAPALAAALLRYERMALRAAEAEILHMADRVVLLNAREAALLADAAPPRPARSARIVTIPPPAPAPVSVAAAPPRRAVFVGTDALAQNRLTIDYLLDLWERARPALPLVIYGRQKRPPRTAPNVAWAGWVDDVAEVYAPGSILLCPVFLRGGIKTKVLEGFAHGVPVIGNPASFEGLDLPAYPLCFADEAALARFLADPAAQRPAMARAVEAASRCLAREHAPEVFRARWAAALGAGERRAATADHRTAPAGAWQPHAPR